MSEVNVTLAQIAIVVEALDAGDVQRLLYVPEPGEEHGVLIVPDDLSDAVAAAIDG
jgi:hypothetical protein